MIGDAAVAYAGRGLAVFPCHSIVDGSCSCRRDCSSPGKHPRTASGLNDATSDATQVAAWWVEHPASNVGLATGAASGLYVVDLDGDSALAEWMALELVHGAAPTLTARTGGGGRHLYYRMPDAELGNTAKRLGRHIDTRGTGGYVLMPPSNHRLGSYRWERMSKPSALPDWVVRELARDRAPSPSPRLPTGFRARSDDRVALRFLDEDAAAVRTAVNGTRNDTLFRRAVRIGELVYGGELVGPAAVDALVAAALECGLRQDEAEKTIRSAFRHGAETPRQIKTRRELEGTA